MAIATYIFTYQKHLLFYINRNNIKITFYLDTKVINSLLKETSNCLYYIPNAYISYYNICYFYFKFLISALLATFVSFFIILLVYA